MDSAVAALKLVEQGGTLEAATLRLAAGGEGRSCCSPGALQRAARTASFLGVPHHELDRESRFHAEVVRPFVDAYLAGETPNPCVTCNPGRLAALVKLADELGLEGVATGHYARLVWRAGRPFVARGLDRAKDQSYTLWAVPREVLERLRFPLAEMTKVQTRAAAEAAGLPVAGEPESQEVCFAPRGYVRFLEDLGVAPSHGAVVDRSGVVVGTHRGHWRYTVGQRRGLGLRGPRPRFVLERRARDNVVVVGERDELLVRRFALRELVDHELASGEGMDVQLRYRSAAVPVERLDRTADARATVLLREPFAAVAPGQSAVFYRDDVVVGGGVVEAGGLGEGGV